MALDTGVHFPDIGAYIGVLNALAGNAAEFESDIVAAVEILDSDYTRVSILPSFISNMVSARNSITSGEANIVSAVTDYHNTVLTEELPSTESTVSGVITDLFAAMGTASETFMSGGNFDTLYVSKFSRADVPTAPSGSHTVDDSLGD